MKPRFEFMDNSGKPSVDLTPKQSSSPVEYALNLWQQFQSNSSKAQRSSQGQFLSPPDVAYFMASLMATPTSSMNVLDPGAGTGILTAALAERLSSNSKVKRVHFSLYETDPELYEQLIKTCSYTKEWLSDRAISSSFEALNSDFILHNEHIFNSLIRLDNPVSVTYDLVIMNPPYFKLRKSDARAKAAQNIVHGQPNIYFIFIMLGSLLLKNKGQLISITPRSFTSGLYFKKFRKEFFSNMHPAYVHLFNSRTSTFKDSDVLQETMILSSFKDTPQKITTITSSSGINDLDQLTTLQVKTNDILRTYDGQVLFLPTTSEELQIMNELENWPETISSLNLRVSTGPVVPFRATKFLVDMPTSQNYVPLFWMHNVQPMEVQWPSNINKPQYIECSQNSKKLLLQNAPYVLLHRFSAKEQKRRFIAAPYEPDNYPFSHIGFENHINYIHRPGGWLNRSECLGLAAILNTQILDKYIRIRSGSTQVNASDMQFLPMPPIDMITSIGLEIENLLPIDIRQVEQFVLSRLKLDYLCSSESKY